MGRGERQTGLLRSSATYLFHLFALIARRVSNSTFGARFRRRVDDDAAQQTIDRLGLGEREITELRQNAIRGALAPLGRWLTLAQCRRLAEALDRAAEAVDGGRGDRLPPYWFALRSAIAIQIRRLGGRRA